MAENHDLRITIPLHILYAKLTDIPELSTPPLILHGLREEPIETEDELESVLDSAFLHLKERIMRGFRERSWEQTLEAKILPQK